MTDEDEKKPKDAGSDGPAGYRENPPDAPPPPPLTPTPYQQQLAAEMERRRFESQLRGGGPSKQRSGCMQAFLVVVALVGVGVLVLVGLVIFTCSR